MSAESISVEFTDRELRAVQRAGALMLESFEDVFAALPPQENSLLGAVMKLEAAMLMAGVES